MPKIIVMGAGLSGTLTALELVKDPTVQVTLLEMGSEILPATSSSINECYRLHMGLHYAKDLPTATNCLHRSIEFARKFPGFVAGHDTPGVGWRRGRHYVMSNSVVNVDHVKDIAGKLNELYRSLVAQDVANKVFGEPEDFIRYLEPSDYTHLAPSIPFYHHDGRVDSISVACAIETGESQVDMPRLKSALKLQVAQHPRIHFKPFNEVIQINSPVSQSSYRVIARDSRGDIHSYSSMSVVNCTWQNIEKLNKTLGHESEDQHRVNRLKASIVVDLPHELRAMNSSIFSLGPYACITIMPDGTAVLTSERTTNIASFPAGPGDDSSEDMQAQVASLTLGTTRGQEVASQILNDCAAYFNAELAAKLRAAPILELRLGWVKLLEIDRAYTASSIYDLDSVIHARPIEGVTDHGLGYFELAGMKMIYTLSGAELVSSMALDYAKEAGKFSSGWRCSPPLSPKFGKSAYSLFNKYKSMWGVFPGSEKTLGTDHSGITRSQSAPAHLESLRGAS